MKLSTILLGGVAVLALGSASFAADLIIEAPAAPAAELSSGTDWTGFYVGANIGYGAGTIEVTNLPIDEEDVGGYFIGAQAGYNFQAGNLVFGIQSDLTVAGVENDEDPADTVDWFGSTTGRVGLALDSMLPYVKAGVAYAGGTGNNDGFEDSASSVGWTAGLGVEVTVADNISVFAEYDYYDFGTAEFSFDGTDVDAETTLHTIKTGLNFKF
jgi:outer membrane immunogenic protein